MTLKLRLTNLEAIYTNLMALAVENKSQISGGSDAIAEIHTDFQMYVANKGKTPAMMSKKN